MHLPRWSILCTLPLWLMGCAIAPPPTHVAAQAPAQWQAPLPHRGQLGDLSSWWTRLNDPLLVQLIEAAQNVSPSVASAASRIAQARASTVGADAALGPSVNTTVNASRSATKPLSPAATLVQGDLQAAWEIDLFGTQRAALNAAQARQQGAQALWHDARVSVAAEVANQYVNVRACALLRGLAGEDARSRQETARLSGLSTRAGFTAPAVDALARASAAEANNRLNQQLTQCDLYLKAMVALTALPEAELAQKLATAPAPSAQIAIFSIASIPAQALAQRPDVFSAERDVAATSFDVGNAQGQRYPSLSLNGSIGAMRYRSTAGNDDFASWSIGPLTVSLPVFDGGQQNANIDAAQARYTEAVALYQAKVRQAVREVEEALVNLRSSDDRMADTQTAAAGYQASYDATQARYKAGVASLPELEDARRTALAADTNVIALQRERLLAWVALYRAVGGGWSGPDANTTASTATTAQ
ncbi:efflux transporter outer membrane subunit [Rhodoferax sp.]|uniref:efflux transporter outer membrane subunit n=1 Tax=Rhodoferax sp. TaxID=50421 RepID=UPI0025CE6DA2|nr:efflux transporter outer membrane subunit [Rhodoferax sp.]